MQLIRKEGKSFPVALREVWMDSVARDRNLTTWLAIEPRKRALQDSGIGAAASASVPGASPAPKAPRIDKRSRQQGREAKKGKGKGGGGKGRTGKGGSSGPPLNCKSQTDKGEPICFAFNRGGCAAKGCRFKHCCGKCFGPHPVSECQQP